MRLCAEISMHMPSVASSTSTGNSKKSMRARAMNSRERTSVSSEPPMASAFMNRAKLSSTNASSQISARSPSWKNMDMSAMPRTTMDASVMIQSPLPARNAPSIRSASAPSARMISGSEWAME